MQSLLFGLTCMAIITKSHALDILPGQSTQLPLMMVTKSRERISSLFPLEIQSMYPNVEPLAGQLWRLRCDKYHIDIESGHSSVKFRRPSSVHYLARELCCATEVHGFLSNIKNLRHQPFGAWCLDYEYMPSSSIVGTVDRNCDLQQDSVPDQASSNRSKKRKKYSAKTLLCAVSQLLRGPPSLDPTTAVCRLKIFETEDTLHFCEVVQDYTELIKESLAEWNKRPYQYSAALHLELAELVLNILIARWKEAEQARARLDGEDGDHDSDDYNDDDYYYDSDSNVTDVLRPTLMNTEHGQQPVGTCKNPIVLDPCCGSGTVLYAARRLGIAVMGSDISPRCVRGTEENLRHFHVYNESFVTLSVKDASIAYQQQPPSFGTIQSAFADIIIANLPWGNSVVDYFGENERILNALLLSPSTTNKPYIICGFVFKSSDNYVGILQSCGMTVLHVIPIGKKINPPRSNKQQFDKSNYAAAVRKDACVVIIAERYSSSS